MRFYYRPPSSPVGVSTGSIGALIIGALWLVVILFYTFFIWPFQFIWVGLPRQFPNSKSVPAWQLGLTIAYVTFLVAAVIAGGKLVCFNSVTSANDGDPFPGTSGQLTLTCLNGDQVQCPDGSNPDYASGAGSATYSCNGSVVVRLSS
jgi:hypothetical protein